MATSNSHRAPGRAITPLRHSGRALRGTGGAAVLGTVLLGSAFAGGTAQAAPAVPASTPAVASPAAAPAAPTPAKASFMMLEHVIGRATLTGTYEIKG